MPAIRTVTVEESTIEASGSTSLRNSTDANVTTTIDFVNNLQNQEKPVNTSFSWRPRFAEFKAMCFYIYSDKTVPEMMTMEKA